MRISIAVLLLLTFLAAPVQGAPASTEVARARALFAEANTLYKLSKFQEALHRYEKVYKLVPRPSALFNIANCYRHLGKRSKAIFYYKLFIDEWAAKNPTRQVPELEIARKHIETLERAARAARPATAKPATSPAKPTTELTRPALVPTTPPPQPQSQSQQSTPVYKKWWFWTIIGVAVAGGATAAGIAATRGGERAPVAWGSFTPELRR
ncbi:MAG: hypothetical protein KAI47_14775 [Deltaproteobacteria bacterium]|nr:hypothetical protein [Deltaproteobacteria bacterium]